MNVLTHLQVDHALSYLIALVIPALDAILPVLPSETAVVALGVATAGSTDPRIALLVFCAALGAFLGDNLSYEIGHRAGPWVERRFFSSDSSLSPALPWMTPVIQAGQEIVANFACLNAVTQSGPH